MSKYMTKKEMDARIEKLVDRLRKIYREDQEKTKGEEE